MLSAWPLYQWRTAWICFKEYLQLIYFNILLYHQVILELRLKWRSILCKETIKASISECPSLRALNLVPFSAQKLSNYLAAVNELWKTYCLSCKIPIFAGLLLGVVTLILGNPFYSNDTNPSLIIFFLMSNREVDKFGLGIYIFKSNLK